jgi:hypothetical protein
MIEVGFNCKTSYTPSPVSTKEEFFEVFYSFSVSHVALPG